MKAKVIGAAIGAVLSFAICTMLGNLAGLNLESSMIRAALVSILGFVVSVAIDVFNNKRDE